MLLTFTWNPPRKLVVFWAGPRNTPNKTTCCPGKPFASRHWGRSFYPLEHESVWSLEKHLLSDRLPAMETNQKAPQRLVYEGFFTPDIMKYLERSSRASRFEPKDPSVVWTCLNSQTKREYNRPTGNLILPSLESAHPPAMPTPRKKALCFGTFF